MKTEKVIQTVTAKDENIKISPTGIEGLDFLLKGGFPEGHVILLSGGAGTGKTMLAMQWLFNGYKKNNESGIYITLTEPITKALQNISNTEFYDKTVTDALKIHFTDLRTAIQLLEIKEKSITKNDIDKIIDTIGQLVKQTGSKRLVIDSITALAYMLNEKDLIRYFVFRLGTMLSTLNCTTILTSEITGGGSSVFGVEEFISDGVIKLESVKIKDDIIRKLQIIKMRGIDYIPKVVDFRIKRDGVHLLLKILPELVYRATNEKVSSGVSGFDDMCYGGLFKGSCTLLAGPTGTGKTVTSLQFINQGLKNGEHCLYVSFEESREQLLRLAQSFGWDFEKYEKDGLLTFLCSYPELAYPIEHLIAIEEIFEKNKINRIVIDSLTALANVLPVETFRDFVKMIVSYCKAKEVTSLVTAATATLMGSETLTEANLSTLTDNIIILKYVEFSGELGFVVAVLKTRSSDRDKKLRKYNIISKKGIVIGEALMAYEGVMTGTSRKIGKTTEEKLIDEFNTVLGPMGLQSYNEIALKGITEKTITEYVDSLKSEGIIKKDTAEKFKQNCVSILNEK
ncbi:DNA repair and recombination protein RadB [Candidatus Tiddalikarchaeum anstoanum]|nr:DNA repair and recombination protein RadB [Candidatus Tiddalikarchaeum anstoanum]